MKLNVFLRFPVLSLSVSTFAGRRRKSLLILISRLDGRKEAHTVRSQMIVFWNLNKVGLNKLTFSSRSSVLLIQFLTIIAQTFHSVLRVGLALYYSCPQLSQ